MGRHINERGQINQAAQHGPGAVPCTSEQTERRLSYIQIKPGFKNCLVNKGTYKWKGEVLKQTLSGVQSWMTTQRPARLEYVLRLRIIGDTNQEIRSEYDPTWLESTFKSAPGAVDFGNVSASANKFLKVYLQCLLKPSTITNI